LSYIKQNLLEIQENIARAAGKSGRKAEDITLVAVTKTIALPQIREAYELGLRDFGENRVQELLPKYEEFDVPNWHMIGHLQTNKVKAVVEKVALIHSVDSLRLAHEIDKRADKSKNKIDILIEINVAAEESKHGILPEKAVELLEQIEHLPNVCIKGLMCVAPFVEDSEENRIYFEKMYKLFVDIQGRRLHNTDMRILSMGMTGDYQVAIEEGANLIRVGTGLFGNREK